MTSTDYADVAVYVLIAEPDSAKTAAFKRGGRGNEIEKLIEIARELQDDLKLPEAR